MKKLIIIFILMFTVGCQDSDKTQLEMAKLSESVDALSTQLIVAKSQIDELNSKIDEQSEIIFKLNKEVTEKLNRAFNKVQVK